jgi:hypothetical protein
LFTTTDVRQLELRAGGELFDHELEVVVAGQRDDRLVGRTHAERGRIVQPSGPAWPQLIQLRALNTCRNCAARSATGRSC